MPTRTYEPISTANLTSNQTTITFSSIPQTYTDLVLIGYVRGTVSATATDVKMLINGDTGTNYSRTYFGGSGTSAFAGRDSNLAYGLIFYSPAGTSTANEFGAGIVHFFNYSNTTTFKPFLSRANHPALSVNGIANLWRSTSAITSLTLTAFSGGDFAAGTNITLYGIKAA